jgi:LmbE family N-acetylglucosaminyl deacetylase
MPTDSNRILVFGAHPDDCDIKAGGLAAKATAAGEEVRFVSMTNGDAGHHEIGGVELARRRRAEASAASDVLDIEYDLLDHHDGELEPTLERRKRIIRLIRNYEPDLILTHRPNDYHPDHRYTSALIQDSAYMVTVPNVCTDTEVLSYNPVIAYLSDDFEKPYPFEPDVSSASTTSSTRNSRHSTSTNHSSTSGFLGMRTSSIQYPTTRMSARNGFVRTGSIDPET